MSAISAKTLVSAIVMLAVCLGLAACTIQSTESRRLGGVAERVGAVQVLFDPIFRGQNVIVQSGRGPQVVGAGQIQTASTATADFETIFKNGFQERFPDLAKTYGLTVAKTALPKLLVRITGATTSCVMSCVTRITLSADLLDMSGKPIWHFSTKPGQSTIFAKIDSQLFDSAAHELLENMKKDGVIG